MFTLSDKQLHVIDLMVSAGIRPKGKIAEELTDLGLLNPESKLHPETPAAISIWEQIMFSRLIITKENGVMTMVEFVREYFS